MDRSPTYLQFNHLKTITNEECWERHRTECTVDYVNKETVCAMPRKHQAACYEDDGGPLTLKGHLVDVASWRLRCDRATGIRSHSHVRQWIKEVSGAVVVQ